MYRDTLWKGLVTVSPSPWQVEGVEEEEVAPEEENENDERTKVKMHSSTVRRLIRRRHKVPDSDVQRRPVSFKELLKLNVPDWPLVLIGVILSAIIGCLFPLMAVLFSEVLRVSRQYNSAWSSFSDFQPWPFANLILFLLCRYLVLLMHKR